MITNRLQNHKGYPSPNAPSDAIMSLYQVDRAPLRGPLSRQSKVQESPPSRSGSHGPAAPLQQAWQPSRSAAARLRGVGVGAPSACPVPRSLAAAGAAAAAPLGCSVTVAPSGGARLWSIAGRLSLIARPPCSVSVPPPVPAKIGKTQGLSRAFAAAAFLRAAARRRRRSPSRCSRSGAGCALRLKMRGICI